MLKITSRTKSSISFGEKKDYIYQKPFDWLRFKGKQYLDFYLPKYNAAIECQGVVQHFVADFIDGRQEGLALRQRMDENKYNLCKKHGIRILYHCTKVPFLPDVYFDKIYHDYHRTYG